MPKKSDLRVPFNRPALAGRELQYIAEALDRGQLAGDGAFTGRCQEKLKELIGSEAILLTHSCTAALEMSAILLDLRPGDEVVMPSFTFVSTANAVVLRGATPVFVDICPETLNIDPRMLEKAVTNNTKAVFAVHYAGVPADMDAIQDVADRFGLSVVEDAAQALGSEYKGRRAGSIGRLAAFSFHETKNLISGEGGCVAINDAKLIERAEIIREKGTNRRLFMRGQVDKYTWVDVGSSYLPGELIASFLYGQLEASEEIARDRMRSWKLYEEALAHFSGNGVRTPYIPDWCAHNAHMYYLVLPTPGQRDDLIDRLRADGILAPFHYVPLHSSSAGRMFGRANGDMSVTDSVSRRLIRLPLYPRMGREQMWVIERVLSHLKAIV